MRENAGNLRHGIDHNNRRVLLCERMPIIRGMV